jgi:two-component system cell cycle response regulator CtrA
MNVLIIEDDLAISGALRGMLKAEGIVTDASRDGEEGIELARQFDYELILLDLGLPDISGVEVLRRLRRAKIVTPVVVVSGEGDVVAKVEALGAGADDYVEKPFRNVELVARLRAVARRARGYAQSRMEIGDMIIDVDARAVHTPGGPVPLTGREFQLLHLLASRRGKAVSREAILNWLYGAEGEPGLKVIDVFVCKLRKKLGTACRIETVWGGGYLLRDPGTGVSTLAAPPPVCAVLDEPERSQAA